MLAELIVTIGKVENHTESLMKGINAYRDAVQFFDSENYPEENEQIKHAIADTYSVLENY